MAFSQKQDTRVSKLISLVLRHDPSALNLQLDAAGWANARALVKAVAGRYPGFSFKDLERIVSEDAKTRYNLRGERIRANQGHSLKVDLGLEPQTPPPTLFHGTIARFLGAIFKEGLRPQGRQHVHLSPDRATAKTVGARRGAPVILCVDAAGLSAAGHLFYQSENGVWLTDHAPASALSLDAPSENS